MNLESLSSSLLFIGPCIIVLYFTFSDRLKAPTLLTVASGIAIFVLIDIALTYIYMTTPLTAFTMALLAISGVMAGVFIFNAVSTYSFAQCLFAVTIVKCYSNAVYLLSAQAEYILGHAPSKMPTLFHLALTFAIMLLTLLLILLFFRKLLRPALDRTEHLPFWNLLWGIPVCSTFFYSLTVFPIFNSSSPSPKADIYLIPLLWIILTFSTYLIIFKMIVETTRNAELTEELHLTETHFDAYKRQIVLLQQKIDETSRIRHDFRHTLIALKAYISNNDLSGMEDYINNYLCHLDSISPTSYCQNPVINTIVSYFADIARDHGISVSISIRLDDAFPFSDIDTCIILGNLLENALEACMRQTEGEKYLHLDICMHHESTLAIIVENSYAGQVRKKEGVFLSSKAERRVGIGIASVRQVARKYNGICQFDYTSRTFKASILLNAIDNGKETA